MRMIIVCLGAIGALACGPVMAQGGLWQVNQPGSSLDVDGLTAPAGGGPITASLPPGTAHSLNFSGVAGQPFELFLAPTPGVPSLLFTATGQVVNIDFTHPGFDGLYSPTLPAMPAGGLGIPFVAPTAPLLISLQMLVFDGAAADGVWLSALNELATPPPGIYVDGDYTGGFGNGSMATPWPTIGQALSAAVPGDVIHVDWSTTPYTEKLFIGSSVTIVGDNWNQPGMPLPVVNPNPGPQGGVPFYILNGTQNVTIERLEIHPGPWDSSLYTDFPWAAGIYVEDNWSDITVRRCRFTGWTQHADTFTWGFVTCAGQNLLIEHCTFTDLDHWVNPGPAPLDTKAVFPLEVYGVTNAVIQNCEFTNIGEANDTFWLNNFSKIIQINTCQNVIFRNNLVHDITWPAVRWDSAANQPSATGTPSPTMTLCDTWTFWAYATDNLQVINNTFANLDMTQCQNPTFQQHREVDFNNCTTIDARNNIVSHASFFTGRGTLPGGVWSGYSAPASQQLYSCVDMTWTTRYFGAITEGTGGIALDPGYLNLPAEDYRLGPGSPCRDTGDPSFLDADNTPSDMGCYGGPRGALPIGAY